ncbi:MAG: biopolymer transporter ExbD [Bacteroidia bacterium]|nr:biopolymer transporter ExbD [Bacteroidia bacterium]
MAEIDGGGGGHKKGGKAKGKKMSTRVDFTPMVDLGFLLITFFMLTTSMNKPQTMEITFPDKEEKLAEEEKTKIKASQAVTLILTDKNKIVYYFTSEDGTPQTPVVIGYGPEGIRKFLLKENRSRNASVDSIKIYKANFKDKKIDEETYKKNVSRIKAFKDGLIVVIKSDDRATYKNLVDILDEMLICNVGRYAVVNTLAEPEKEMLQTVQSQL